MFNIFKKRDKYSALIAAARGIMANDSLIQPRPKTSQTLTLQEVHRHRFIRKYASIQEADNENMVTDPRLGDSPVPFGFSNHQWRELLAEMQDGDELWTFSTSDESWDNRCGRAGISLVRNGKEVTYIVRKMN
jgi:hypothetical protein